MRVVTASVAQAKRIKLSKASAIVSRFAASGGGADPEVAAYLGRAAIAFEELVNFHRGVAGGEWVHQKKEKEAEDGDDVDLTDVGEEKSKKKRRRR